MLTVSQRSKFMCMYSSGDLMTDPINFYNYTLDVTVSANQSFEDTGCIFSFEDLKTASKLVEFSNMLLVTYNQLETSDCDVVKHHIDDVAELFHFLVDPLDCENITTEFLLSNMAERLQAYFDEYYPGVVVEEMKLYESSQSYSTWKNLSKPDGWDT